MKIEYTEDQIQKSKEVSKQNMEVKNPSVIELCNERFLLMPHVFSPELFPSSKIFYPNFPYKKESRFLDIGCGAGYGAILAVKNGAEHATATDINLHALENAELNCKLHKVENKVTVIESDLFSNIKEKYSTIYWNHPFITAPKDYKFENIIEKAIFDPGYKLLEKFIKQASKYLSKDGRVLVGLADVGGLDSFRTLAKQNSFSEKEILRQTGVEGNEIEITLHELKLK